MSRIARIIMPEVPHHVTQRGNRRQQTFFCNKDYEIYLDLLNANSKAFGIDVWSYCLMPNHVHLLLVPRNESSIRDGVSQAHISYTRRINRQRKWTGHLWQGRYFSCPVEPRTAAIVARYIELNPVKAGLCDNPGVYPWSSAFYACSNREDARFGQSPLIAQVGNWSKFLEAGISPNDNIDALRKASTSGRPFGSEQFVRCLEGSLGRSLGPAKRGRRTTSTSLDSQKELDFGGCPD